LFTAITLVKKSSILLTSPKKEFSAEFKKSKKGLHKFSEALSNIKLKTLPILFTSKESKKPVEPEKIDNNEESNEKLSNLL
jgi:hypothetical protein